MEVQIITIDSHLETILFTYDKPYKQKTYIQQY